MSLRIVLAGEESAGRLAFQVLQAEGVPPVAVLTSSAGLQPGSASLARLAERAGIPVLPPQLVREPGFAEELRDRGVDLLLNVHSLYLVHDAVAAAPHIGCFNLHPGPLPAYAGLNTPSWAIANGETTHGVTLHWMDSGVDSGPIAYQALFPILPADTGLLVSVRCVQQGIPLIRRLIGDAAADPRRIPAVRQDAGRRSYFHAGPPDGGRLRWEQPAARIERLVRAFDYTPLPSPWGRLTCRVDGRCVEIRKVEFTGEPCSAEPGTVRHVGGESHVATADEWLRLVAIGVEGERVDARSLSFGARLASAAMLGLLL